MAFKNIIWELSYKPSKQFSLSDDIARQIINIYFNQYIFLSNRTLHNYIQTSERYFLFSLHTGLDIYSIQIFCRGLRNTSGAVKLACIELIWNPKFKTKIYIVLYLFLKYIPILECIYRNISENLLYLNTLICLCEPWAKFWNIQAFNKIVILFFVHRFWKNQSKKYLLIY